MEGEPQWIQTKWCFRVERLLVTPMAIRLQSLISWISSDSINDSKGLKKCISIAFYTPN